MYLDALKAWPQLTKSLTQNSNNIFFVHLCSRYRERNGELTHRILVSLTFLKEKEAQTCYDLLIENERTPESIFQKLAGQGAVLGQRLD